MLPVPGHYVHCDLQLLRKQPLDPQLCQLEKRMKKTDGDHTADKGHSIVPVIKIKNYDQVYT